MKNQQLAGYKRWEGSERMTDVRRQEISVAKGNQRPRDAEMPGRLA